jgi:hypothetical protein
VDAFRRRRKYEVIQIESGIDNREHVGKICICHIKETVMKKIHLLLLIGFAFSGIVYAQTPIIDLSKLGITLSQDQKQQIIDMIRVNSPWIPADSIIDVSIKVELSIVDNTSIGNIEDTAVFGKWTAVDFVSNVEDFKPNSKAFKGSLYWTSLYLDKGNSFMSNLGNGKWAKGKILFGNMVQNYEIKTFDGKTYLFVQWKSGDYSIRGNRPQYYVFKKD